MLTEECIAPGTASKNKYKMPHHEFWLSHNLYKLDQLTGFLRTWVHVTSECYKYIPWTVEGTNEDSGDTAVLQRGFNSDK